MIRNILRPFVLMVRKRTPFFLKKVPLETTFYRGARISHPSGHGLVYQLIRQHREFEPEEWAILSKWAVNGAHSLDIGANVGIHALPLAAQNPHGMVYAFEAHPANFSYLTLGILDNGLTHALEPFQGAVADYCGLMTFSSDSRWGSTSAGIVDTGRGGLDKQSLTVPSITLDYWMEIRKPEKIDFIKIDIEGAELLALSGASHLLKIHKPKILMECEPSNLLVYNKTIDDVFDFADKAGYTVHDLNMQSLSLDELHSRNASIKHAVTNVVLIPRD